VLQHCLHDHGKRYELHAAVVMPEHVHLLLTPLRDEKGWPYGLPSILKLLKGTSARSVNRLLGSSGPVWQEESFDHVPRTQESFEAKLEYIRQNPVRRGQPSKIKTKVKSDGQECPSHINRPPPGELMVCLEARS
jgi:REP element-mobilizing transposase RayT